jgi:photosystem II stability/assembly factor-like uncharacterized protein
MAWLRSIYFLDQNRGWVAGSNGTLLQTTDGGLTWRKVASLTKDTLHDVYFADQKTGWLLAERDVFKLQTDDEPRSYLLQTEDGGISWRRIFLKSETNSRLLRLAFADAQRGWVFGETGVVFVTRDGGAQWTRQALPTKHLLLGGAFNNYANLLLVGAGATIMQTKDGGMTWQRALLRDAATARFTAASSAGGNLGWVVGMSGSIYTTADGGRNWYGQRSNVDADLFDVKFIDAAEGWAVGSDGVLLHTTDGGAHWTLVTSGTSHVLQRLFFTDRNHGWAVGFGGTILRYGQAAPPQLRD